MDGLSPLSLVEPDASHAVGLVASEREPLPPVTRTFLDVAKKSDLNGEIGRQFGQMISPAGHSPHAD